MRESQIENEFVAYAESRGCLCEKLVIHGTKGWPDRTIFCPNGRLLIIEFKKPGGRCSRHQIEKIQELTKRNFEVYVYDTFAAAKATLDDCLQT